MEETLKTLLNVVDLHKLNKEGLCNVIAYCVEKSDFQKIMNLILNGPTEIDIESIDKDILLEFTKIYSYIINPEILSVTGFNQIKQEIEYRASYDSIRYAKVEGDTKDVKYSKEGDYKYPVTIRVSDNFSMSLDNYEVYLRNKSNSIIM